MKSIVAIFVLLVFIFSSPNPAFTREPSLSSYQRNVISYFKEVALGFEYGHASHVTRKWKHTMKIFVHGNPGEGLQRELKQVVNELNDLITDEFKIVIVTNRYEANFHAYFGSSDAFAAMFPIDAHTALNNSGLFRIYWTQHNEITKGYMFIRTKGTTLVEQRSVLREELTQALGLGTDSARFPESIFQSRYSTPTSFADIDKDLIRLLYHPAMIVGLSAPEAEALLTHILLNEKGT